MMLDRKENGIRAKNILLSTISVTSTAKFSRILLTDQKKQQAFHANNPH
ncbi:hypothetical protein [Paenibacillus baekrokdamisoli]|nr:hypothetical protein [Paenibacillus baekrokdamisoli]